MGEGMRLKDRTAIVTGGAQGFGEGIVRRFVDEGARVAIVDRNLAAASALAAELRAATIAVEADVSSDADVARMAADVAAALGPVEILVNNAGVGHTPQPLDVLSEADFDRIWAVNVKSVYLTARHLVPAMKAAGRGAILNVASTGGVSPRPNLTWYNASKGWAITATKSMAVELAPKRIRVNCLCPVAGETGMLAQFMGEDTPEKRALFRASIPLGRLSTPLDIANAALYLVSDEASLITGVAFEVDGGRCI